MLLGHQCQLLPNIQTSTSAAGAMKLDANRFQMVDCTILLGQRLHHVRYRDGMLDHFFA